MTKNILKLYSKPLTNFLIIVSTIAFVEYWVMRFLPQLQESPILNLAIIDVLILSLVITPILYLLFFRPLRININSLQQANKRISQQQYIIEKAKELGRFGAWDLDFETNKLTWTDEVYRIFGVPIGTEINYDTFLDLTHPDDKDFVDLAWKAALKGKTYDVEHRILVDGCIKWVRDKAEIEFRKVGVASRGIGFVQDISEAKALQEKTIRAAQLSSLGELAASVAHEINNPVNGIINYAQLLLNKEPEDTFSKNVLEGIVTEGHRVAGIVSSLLNYARNDKEENAFIDPAALFVGPLNLMMQFFKLENIHVDVKIDQNLSKVYCNAMQIEQVILNLLSNARHALNDKYPTEHHNKIITVHAEENVESGLVQITVQDMGTGISKEIMDRLFEPFFTTKKAGIGTGIGLSISKDILDQNRGDISIESELGEYTKITLSLPITEG